MKEKVCLVAGGTGGHINAAISVGEKLTNEYDIIYISGTRYLDQKLFKNYNTIFLDSKPLRTLNPIKLFKNIILNILVFLKFSKTLLNLNPKFIIGAGGYVCGPTLFAGWLQKIPIFIIEQNAVLGMTNKLLSRIASKIFTNFEKTKGLENKKNIVVSGNPVRSSIKFSQQSYIDGLKILVFGGSLGASQINNMIEELLKLDGTPKLYIRHQVGKNNKKTTIECSEQIHYEQFEYIEDMNEAYAWCNIIIARSGASTISELKTIGKPAILLPYPAATDNHQYYNALLYKQETEAFVLILDNQLASKDLANQILETIYSLQENRNLMRSLPAKEPTDAADFIIKEIKNYVNSK